MQHSQVLEAMWSRRFTLTVGDGAVQGHGRLVGPASGHVADSVAPAAQHQQGQIEALHVLHTLGMA